MRRTFFACLLIAIGTLPSSGCSICQGPEDYTYGYYGGLYQRTDPVHGRAGSILDGGGETVVTAAGETIIEEGEEYYEEGSEVYFEEGE